MAIRQPLACYSRSVNDSSPISIDRSLRVHAADFRTDWLRTAAEQLGFESITPPHRKVWEFAVIAAVMTARLSPLRALSADLGVPFRFLCGRRPRVLGFGVGREPLPAWFVGQGCDVLATDKPEANTLAGWKATGQHAADHAQLGRLGYVSETEMIERCEYRAIDMVNLLPRTDILRGEFDFTYSCGSFEHIGGAHAGLLFFALQMHALRPGGIAVHTTEYEYEYSPADLPPLDTPDLSLYRAEDISRLAVSLAAQGDLLLPLDAAQGTEPWDLYIDTPPYSPDAISHLNIELVGGRRTTSIALIAIRGGGQAA